MIALVGLGASLNEVSAVATRLPVGSTPDERPNADLVNALVVVQGLVIAAEVFGLVPQRSGDIAQLAVSAAVMIDLGMSMTSSNSEWPCTLKRVFGSPEELTSGSSAGSKPADD